MSFSLRGSVVLMTGLLMCSPAHANTPCIPHVPQPDEITITARVVEYHKDTRPYPNCADETAPDCPVEDNSTFRVEVLSGPPEAATHYTLQRNHCANPLPSELGQTYRFTIGSNGYNGTYSYYSFEKVTE